MKVSEGKMLDEEEDWCSGDHHDEASSWSQGEDSDMEDLAELEARLYSQYHYEVNSNSAKSHQEKFKSKALRY